MQPASSASSPVRQQVASTETDKKRKADQVGVEEKETPEQKTQREAQARELEKMFEAGATSGGIASTTKAEEVKTVSISEEKEHEITRCFADTVEQIIKNPEVEKGIGVAQQMPQTLDAVKKNIAFIESYYSPEEKAICDYLTELATIALKPILKMCSNPLYANAPDAVFEPAIKRAMQKRTSEKELDLVQKTSQILKKIYSGDLRELVAAKKIEKTNVDPIVGFHLAVTKEVVENPLLLMTLVLAKQNPASIEQMKAELNHKLPTLTEQERALFNHLATAICAEYTPLFTKLASQMPQLQGIPDETILLAIKQVFLPKIKDTTAKFAQVAPEHLAKIVKTAPYQEHVLLLGMLQKKVDGLARDTLTQLKAAMTCDDKAALPSFFIAHADNAVLKEVDAFLKSVPEFIHPSIVKALAEGIDDTLRRK